MKTTGVEASSSSPTVFRPRRFCNSANGRICAPRAGTISPSMIASVRKAASGATSSGKRCVTSSSVRV